MEMEVHALDVLARHYAGKQSLGQIPRQVANNPIEVEIDLE